MPTRQRRSAHFHSQPRRKPWSRPNQSILQQAIASGALTLPTTLSAAQLLLLEALFLVRSGLATDSNVSGLVAILGGGLTTLGISAIGSAGFNFGLNTSDSRALDDITVRVGDRQTTTLRVGEKYPITTSTYSSGLSSATTAAVAGATINGVSVSSLLASASSAVIPIIQYEDLGITLKTAPSVLKSGLIALHIDLKIEALTGRQPSTTFPFSPAATSSPTSPCPTGSPPSCFPISAAPKNRPSRAFPA